MVKSELEKLSLIELKNLCKKEGLNFIKKNLIKIGNYILLKKL